MKRTFKIYSDVVIIFLIISEVSPAWSRYELPKLGIAGSNPALRSLTLMDTRGLSTNPQFLSTSAGIFVDEGKRFEPKPADNNKYLYII
jgi:hypothetical protein